MKSRIHFFRLFQSFIMVVLYQGYNGQLETGEKKIVNFLFPRTLLTHYRVQHVSIMDVRPVTSSLY